MLFEILFSIACIFAAVAITAITVVNNKDMDGKTPIGWWIIGAGFSQLCIVIMLAVWWKDWVATHLWILYVSCGITIAALCLWVVAKMYTRRY
jgi:predicted lysophospholipase L1 biosynthesis ABC-type transport system permease subunit